jgi:monofunctional biosynthetic peptidoglycan transglycosylase
MYDIEFPTAAGKWIEVDLPIAKLRRNIRGYRPNTKPPQPEGVTGIGILIGDKKAGPFRLEIDWIRKQM